MSKLEMHHKLRNTLHSMLLLAAMFGLLLLVACALFGSGSLPLMAAVAVLIVFLAPHASAWLTLYLYRARPMSRAHARFLYRLVDELADGAGLADRIRLFIIPASAPNAFAMLDRGQPLIAVTDGLLRMLDERELCAVFSHEISHIRNHDIGVMMLADSLSRITDALASSGQLMLLLFFPVWLFSGMPLPWTAMLLMITAPAISLLLQLALSRTREFDADLDAVRLTGDPTGLAQALVKIDGFGQRWWRRLLFPVRSDNVHALLRSHPLTGERIARLRRLAEDYSEMAHAAYVPDAWSAHRPHGLDAW